MFNEMIGPKMDKKRLLSYTRRAVDAYDMISDGDKIAVAVSGGKDSLTLALAMKGLERFYPKRFQMAAYTVDIGFGNDMSALYKFFDEAEIPFKVVKTQIREIVFDIRKEENPCALCASLRKGALYTELAKDGFNKVALGHHKEDVIGTFLLSLMYEGRFNTFQPVTELTRSQLTVIRPLIYVPESEIVYFANSLGLPIVKNLCPVDGYTKRQEMNDLLRSLKKQDHEIPNRIFSAIQSSSLEGWHTDFVPNRQPLKESSHELS